MGKKRKWLWGVIATAAVLAVVATMHGSGDVAPKGKNSHVVLEQSRSRDQTKTEWPTLDLRRLSRRIDGSKARDIFKSKFWTASPLRNKHGTAPVRSAPPLPFSYIGKLTENGQTTVFLAKGDRNYVVRLHSTIDDTYRVDKITTKGVELIYLPLKVHQTLRIGASN